MHLRGSFPGVWAQGFNQVASQILERILTLIVASEIFNDLVTFLTNSLSSFCSLKSRIASTSFALISPRHTFSKANAEPSPMAATMAAATMAFVTSPARLTPGIAFSALIAALAAMLLFGSDIDRACPRCSAHGRLFGKQTYSCVEILVEPWSRRFRHRARSSHSTKRRPWVLKGCYLIFRAASY